MVSTYCDIAGNAIEPALLSINRAKEIVEYIEKLPFFRLVECKRIDAPSSVEIIVFDVDVEVGQRSINDIHRSERIAVVFSAYDYVPPEVLALRQDFPRVPHLNLRPKEKPYSLCLFDQRYEELKLYLTPALFLERIREWLSLTARGELHAEDQPLEPLLMGPVANLIIPHDLFTKDKTEGFESLIIRRIPGEDMRRRMTLIGEREKDINQIMPEDVCFMAIPIQGEPQQHGIIYKQPSSISELHEFLKIAQLDLLTILRSYLKELLQTREKTPDRDFTNAYLILVVYLPKTDRSDSPSATDIWAFIIDKPIREIGVDIGLWNIPDNNIGILIPTDFEKKGEDSPVSLLNPTPSYSRELAKKLAGLPDSEDKDIILIGGGALGSQVFMNLVRMGYGKWTVVDEDYILPHNIARHALFGNSVGYSKSLALVATAKMIINDESIATPITANVLNPAAMEEELSSKYKQVQLIIDASTSIPVARYIAKDIDSQARRISIFLNPSGSDVVLLAEDSKRDISLDCLEMQYYRFLIHEKALRNHLFQNESYITYARSCRDVGSSIPQDLVALNAAICSREIINILESESACLQIWATYTKDMTVKTFRVPVEDTEMLSFAHYGWDLYVDKGLLGKIYNLREERLPNETGGVLIGSFDVQRKIVYVADMIPSPPDSIEWPTNYIRGCYGLQKKVSEIKEITANTLEYIGEWHSHPGKSPSPGAEDKEAFSWLSDIMGAFGLPALMLIVADQAVHSFYLGEME